jgi:hypothetical protein
VCTGEILGETEANQELGYISFQWMNDSSEMRGFTLGERESIDLGPVYTPINLPRKTICADE